MEEDHGHEFESMDVVGGIKTLFEYVETNTIDEVFCNRNVDKRSVHKEVCSHEVMNDIKLSDLFEKILEVVYMDLNCDLKATLDYKLEQELEVFIHDVNDSDPDMFHLTKT